MDVLHPFLGIKSYLLTLMDSPPKDKGREKHRLGHDTVILNSVVTCYGLHFHSVCFVTLE